MEWKDIIPVLAGGLVILVVALVVKPALVGEPAVATPGPVLPAYVPPAPLPAATPFPEVGAAHTRTFRWTAIDGGVHTTEVRVPEALFLAHRETPRFADRLAWGRYALAEEDRPILADLARRIAPADGNPEEEYFGLMNLIFFVQQIPYEPDNSTDSYIEGALPRHARPVKDGIEYPKYPAETLVDGKGDCEDSAILLAGLLDALGYDTVLLLYPDHMALGIRMDGFHPYYAKYTPKYFDYGGKHYYYVEGTTYYGGKVSADSPVLRGKPFPIGDTEDASFGSVKSGTPEIVPLHSIPAPAEYRIRPARLPAGGA
jgi:hypothetical protein